jgi:hypothetical protein
LSNEIQVKQITTASFKSVQKALRFINSAENLITEATNEWSASSVDKDKELEFQTFDKSGYILEIDRIYRTV